MRLVSIISLLYFFVLNMSSQSLVLSFENGVGSYKMDYLKTLNADVQSLQPFSTKVVSNFPKYYYFRPGIGLKFNRSIFEFKYGFESTGSRISSVDNSGEYTYDMIVYSKSPSVSYQYILLKKFLDCSIYTNLGYNFSTLTTSEDLIAEGVVLKDYTNHYETYGTFIEPGIKLEFPMKQLKLGLNLGYLFSYEGKPFHLKDAIFNELHTSDYKNIYSDWEGVRLAVVVSYCFAKEKASK